MLKKIKKVIPMLILSCILLICTSCGKTDEQLSQSNAGEPHSDWNESPTGSAKYLDGDTVLVSIFLEDTDANWTKADRQLAKDNLEIACQFLKNEGKRYGKDVNLIYDTDAHPDLEYHYQTGATFPGSTYTTDEGALGLAATLLLSGVNEYIYTNIDVENILSSYGVNSIGFLVFVDNKTSQATAYPYYADTNVNYYSEICFINLRWSKTDKNVTPDTYAHEILHLFGARDLYRTTETDGITREYVDYVYKKYPTDIMLGAARKGVRWNKKISGKITDVTAYFLGWKDTIYETELFPKTKAKYKASFLYLKEPSEDFVEYTASSRSISERNFWYNLLYIGIIVFIMIFDTRSLLRKKQNTLDASQNQQVFQNEPEAEAMEKD